MMKKSKDKKLSTEESILYNTKTIILLMCVLVISSLLSVIFAGYSLYYTKQNNNNNEVVEKAETDEYDVSMFTSINTDKFIKLFKKDEKSLIYLGRSTCSYCVKFLPNLQKAQEEYGYQTYYLDITTVNDKGVDSIGQLDKFLKENYGYTPMVVIVEDGKILNSSVDNYDGVGFTEYSTFTKFLEKAGYNK